METTGIIPIRARPIISNYRNSGYTLATITDELIDNILDAIRTLLRECKARISLFAISEADDRLNKLEAVDQGVGMTLAQMIRAFHLGAEVHSGPGRIGKHHTGLKSLSFNFGYNLKLISRVEGGAIYAIEMDTRRIVRDEDELTWSIVEKPQEHVSAENWELFVESPSGTIVVLSDPLEKTKIKMETVGNMMLEESKQRYKSLPANLHLEIMTSACGGPVMIIPEDYFYNLTPNYLESPKVNLILKVYSRLGKIACFLESKMPLQYGKAGATPLFTKGSPLAPVLYAITKTLDNRARQKNGKPISWLEEGPETDFTLLGTVGLECIWFKEKNNDGVATPFAEKPGGYWLYRDNRLVGHDTYLTDDRVRRRMRGTITFSPDMDVLFGVQFNKITTTGVQNTVVKEAIDEMWNVITKPWLKAINDRVQAKKAAAVEHMRDRIREEERAVLNAPPAEQMPVCIAWVRAHLQELREPAAFAQVCALLGVRPM